MFFLLLVVFQLALIAAACAWLACAFGSNAARLDNALLGTELPNYVPALSPAVLQRLDAVRSELRSAKADATACWGIICVPLAPSNRLGSTE